MYDWITVPTLLPCAGHAVQRVHEIERALRVGRALHVDAHKIRRAHAGRFLHQSGHQVARQLFVDVEAHVGQLQAHVRFELVGRDLVEQLVIELSAGARFLNVGDVLAQVVDADGDSPLVQFGGHADRVFDLVAGYEPAGDTLSDDGSFSDGAEGAAFREGDEQGSQHGRPSERAPLG